MDMDTMKQTEFLNRTIHDAKRKIVLGAIVASVVSVLLFVLGSYYLLFHVYEDMTKDYYTSLLNSVSSFQTDLISRESTIGDLEHIAGELSVYRGVKEVWFTDRFGRLVFATDGELLSQFKNRRLPSEYFESVQHIWSFENGRPVPKTVPVTKFLFRRVSIPIYPFRNEGYDFVMGIDVSRFVYLPRMDLLIYLSAGYFVIFSALLFFPLFFWVSSRLGSITVRVPMIVGLQESGMRAATQVKESPPDVREDEPRPSGTVDTADVAGYTETGRGTAGHEEKPEPQAGKKVNERTSRPSVKKKEQVDEEKPTADGQSADSPSGDEEPATEAASHDHAGDKGGDAEARADAIARFAKKKKDFFMHEDVQLPFINAGIYVHNSNGIDGSYTYTHRTGDKVYFVSFLLPYRGAEDALANLDGLLKTFNERIEAAGHIREFSRSLNEACLENGMKLNLSVIAVETEEKSVRYSAFGSGRAFCLKSGKEEAKELVLSLPELGAVTEDVFSEQESFADIRFQKNDLFVMLPQDVIQPGAGPDVGPSDLGKLISGMLLEMKEKSAFECSISMGRKLHELSGSRQTGLVTVKFL